MSGQDFEEPPRLKVQVHLFRMLDVKYPVLCTLEHSMECTIYESKGRHGSDHLCTLCGKDFHDEDENQVKCYVGVHNSNFNDLEQIYDKNNDFVDE